MQAKFKNLYEININIIGKFAELLFGVFCIIMTPYIGSLGSIFFIAAVFYFIPDSLVKGSMYIHRVLHYKDYIVSNDCKIEEFYLKVVMDAMRRKGTLTN